MSLSDRLAEARRARGVDASVDQQSDALVNRAKHRRLVDPFAELKQTVHQTLLENLGPQLYDSRLTQSELEQKVRLTLQEVLAQEETPLTVQDRARIAQEDRRRDPRLRPARALPARHRGHRGHGQRLRHDLHRAQRQDRPGRRRTSTTTRTCVAPSTRSSAASDAASTSPARWSTPDFQTGAASTRSSRPLAVDGSLLTIRKFAADPYQVDDLIGFGTLTPEVADFLDACVRGKAQHPGHRRHRRRQDDHAQRALRRSSRRTSGSSRSRTPPSSSCTRSTCIRLESRPPNIEGKGEVTIRDLVRELAAHATRPHRRR